MRRLLVVLAALLIALGAWLAWRRTVPVATGAGSSATPTAAYPVPAGTPVPAAAGASDSSAEPPAEARITLADPLNAPDGDIHRDLRVLQDILIAWRTNFPHEGNPVGENNEITAALTGRNQLRLALIPANHPAINAQGELCDRWGTPFHFHQLSGTRMEIRSAGPDRKLWTVDDVMLAP